jgi:hypothetical protein
MPRYRVLQEFSFNVTGEENDARRWYPGREFDEEELTTMRDVSKPEFVQQFMDQGCIEAIAEEQIEPTQVEPTYEVVDEPVESPMEGVDAPRPRRRTRSPQDGE